VSITGEGDEFGKKDHLRSGKGRFVTAWPAKEGEATNGGGRSSSGEE